MDWRFDRLNGALSAVVVCRLPPRCNGRGQKRRVAELEYRWAAHMDSKIVNRSIRDRIWPRLRDHGFVSSSRSAWRHHTDRVDVVDFQSFNSYNAQVIGCTTFSFAVNLGCYLLSIPPSDEPARIKQNGGRPIPAEYQCHFRSRLSPSIPQPQLNSADIWFIEESGKNLDSSLDDVWDNLQRTGLQWFEQFANPNDVLRILLTEQEQMSRLWGFGNNSSPLRHYLIGYVARSLGDAPIAAEHLQAASASQSFTSIQERLVFDARAAAQQIIGPERR